MSWVVRNVIGSNPGLSDTYSDLYQQLGFVFVSSASISVISPYGWIDNKKAFHRKLK